MATEKYRRTPEAEYNRIEKAWPIGVHRCINVTMENATVSRERAFADVYELES